MNPQAAAARNFINPDARLRRPRKA